MTAQTEALLHPSTVNQIQFSCIGLPIDNDNSLKTFCNHTIVPPFFLNQTEQFDIPPRYSSFSSIPPVTNCSLIKETYVESTPCVENHKEALSLSVHSMSESSSGYVSSPGGSFKDIWDSETEIGQNSIASPDPSDLLCSSLSSCGSFGDTLTLIESNTELLNDQTSSFSHLNKSLVSGVHPSLGDTESSSALPGALCDSLVSGLDQFDDHPPTYSPVPDNSCHRKLKSTDEIRRRVTDNDGFIRRAACICVNQDESQVMLITSKTDPEGWLIPGGGLEDHEREEEAAERETWEEAGVKGQILRCLGTFQCEDEQNKKKKRTTVYVLKVTESHEDFPESTTYGRLREWFSVEEAIKRLKRCKPNQIAYLRAL